jgi:hypothetical protein
VKYALLFLACTSVFLIGALSCNIEQSSTCSDGVRYLGLENDTGGYNNAHVENYTNTDYGNSLCCELDGDTLVNTCGTTLFKLSDETNAHVEQSNESNYAVSACMDAALTDFTCTYTVGSCAAGYTCVLSFANADGTGNNYTNNHVGDCNTYDRKLCCTTNTRPSVPVLITPSDGNTSVFSRFTYFNWTSTDPDGDTITYYWNLSSPPGCAVIPEKNTTSNEYTSVDKLCVDETYNWTVKACDAGGCSAYATPFNFTITSVVGIAFMNESIDFGTLSTSVPGAPSTDNTSANAPYPLRYNNTGNVDVRTQTKANAALWTNVALNDTAFSYADENSSSWQNWTQYYTALTSNLTYPAMTRELEVLVTVPLSEPAGTKNTTVTVLAITLE